MAAQVAGVALGVIADEAAGEAAQSLGADVFTITPADVQTDVGNFLRGTQFEFGKYIKSHTFIAVKSPLWHNIYTGFRSDYLGGHELLPAELEELVCGRLGLEAEHVVRAQYTTGWVGGEEVRGYREEEGVDPGSVTPTFAGIRIYVDTWRWQGVPFLLRTGKRLPKRSTEIAIRFRVAPHRMSAPAGSNPMRGWNAFL